VKQANRLHPAPMLQMRGVLLPLPHTLCWIKRRGRFTVIFYLRHWMYTTCTTL